MSKIEAGVLQLDLQAVSIGKQVAEAIKRRRSLEAASPHDPATSTPAKPGTPAAKTTTTTAAERGTKSTTTSAAKPGATTKTKAPAEPGATPSATTPAKPGAKTTTKVKPGAKAVTDGAAKDTARAPAGGKAKGRGGTGGAPGPADKDAKPESEDAYVRRLAQRARDFDGWDTIEFGVLQHDNSDKPQRMIIYIKHKVGTEVLHVTADLYGTVTEKDGHRFAVVQQTGVLVASDGRTGRAGAFDGGTIELH
jgi:hypothetical protein